MSFARIISNATVTFTLALGAACSQSGTGSPPDARTTASSSRPSPPATPSATQTVSPSPPVESPLLDANGKPLTKQPAGIQLACQAERVGEDLHIRFDVKNATKEAVHVFDDRGQGDFRPSILSDGGGGAVHVLYGVPPLPPFPTYSKYFPKVTTLAPLDSVHRDAVIKIPLREVGAYYPTKYDAYVPAQVTRVVLRVDFLRASKTTDDKYTGEPRGATESVSCNATLPAPVELQRRGDPFQRI